MAKVILGLLVSILSSLLVSCHDGMDEIKSYQNLDLQTESTYYWKSGEKRNLLVNKDELYIVFKVDKKNFPQQINWLVYPREISIVQSLENSSMFMEAFVSVRELSKVPNVYYKSRVVTEQGISHMQDVGVSLKNYVKLKSGIDVSWLRTVAKEYHLEDVQKEITLPQWYSFKCTNKTPFDALEILNILYESGNMEKIGLSIIQKNNTPISPLD